VIPTKGGSANSMLPLMSPRDAVRSAVRVETSEVVFRVRFQRLEAKISLQAVGALRRPRNTQPPIGAKEHIEINRAVLARGRRRGRVPRGPCGVRRL